MLKFRVDAKDTKTRRPLVGLGLSFRNLALLQQGKPIFIDSRKLGLDTDVVLFAGETERSMVADLRDRGVIPREFEPERE